MNRVGASLASVGGVVAVVALAVGGTTVVRNLDDTPTASEPPGREAADDASTSTTAPATTATSATPGAAPTTAATTPPFPTAAAAHDWQLVATDEFDGGAIDTERWTLYDSVGNDGIGYRRPSAISVADGELRITGRGDVSGGLNWNGGRTYGRWEVRARMDAGNGYSPAILLWPSSGNWPAEGEIDLSEIPRGDRSQTHFTMHWGTENSQVGFDTPGDFTQWHTFAIEWQPDHVTFFLDGEEVYTNDDPVAIPRDPMHLAMQNDVGPNGTWIPPRDASTPDEVALHVDWVRLYS